MLGDDLVGVYGVGSFAFDAYEQGRSDLDVIAVVREPLSLERKQAIVDALRYESLPCPARGLELVVYSEDAVRTASTAPAYELDLNTGETMPFRAAFDANRPDLHWFAIDRAIAREHGITLYGPPARELFAEIPRKRLLPLVARSLDWYRENDPANASRVWRYTVEGVWSSKPAAAEWARERRASGVATIGDAVAAYRLNRLDDAKAAFHTVVADPEVTARDRATAACELARMAWLIEGDVESACEWLRWHEDNATAAMLVRVLRESGRTNEAVRVVGEDDDELLIQRARAWADLGELDRLAATLERLTDEARHGTAASRLELELGLLAGDVDRAIAGWKQYFWLVDDDVPPALEERFPDLHDVFLDETEVVALLVRTGFHREASRYASLRDVNEFDDYFALRNELERATLEHNRALARGDADSEAYEAQMNELLVGSDRWGVFWTVGLTGGYMSVHAGHVIEDAEERVEQDGRTGSVRLIVIDNMLANGYESWLWDGAGQAGGWATDTAIVQIRTSYVDSVVDALRHRQGTPARARADAELPDLNGLPRLAARLKLQAIDQIAERTGPDATAFQSAYWHALVEGTLTVHEGRHALDQQQFRDGNALSSEELEYRAKLAELRFAPYPRLDLAKIAGGVFGGDTSHGQANSRVLTELAGWAEEHCLDEDDPSLMSLDRLTDDQLRSFATAFDRF